MAEFSVVLVEPKYDGNIGSVARLMKNFGYSKLVLVNPPEIAKDGRSMAMHARDILESAVRVDDYSKLTQDYDFLVATTAVLATDSNSRRTPIFPEDLSGALETEGKIALVFGREDHGLSNEEIEQCDLIVTIPGSREYPTLNLSQSVAIILYELSKAKMRRDMQGLKKLRKIEKIEKDVLLEKFDDLAGCVYLNEYELHNAKKTFRQLIGRAFISGREAFTLTGTFRKAANKIRKKQA